MNADAKILRAVDTLDPKDFEPFVREVSDNIYERLLYTVQDHLRDNAEWNLRMELDQSRTAARHAEKQLAEISDALGVSPYSQEARMGRIGALNERYALYDDLIYAVARKFEGEPRHETALRYIREREAASGIEARSDATPQSGAAEGESPAPEGGDAQPQPPQRASQPHQEGSDGRSS